ncbi:MAG: hypothetical protein AAF327_14785 [Cyanobacteria bacterium P01_A01_bin.37]
MSELHLSGNRESFDEQTSRIFSGSDVGSQSGDALAQGMSLRSSEHDAVSVAPSDRYALLLDELAKTQSLECQHIRRIYQLERALDQVLIYLEELKVKVRDRDDLHDQLLMTEDFAYVQQHAIAHLKKQLQHHKQILISHSSDAQEYDEAVQSVLGETEQLVEYQQVELEHLKARLAQDLAEDHKRYSLLKKKFEMLQANLLAEQARTQQIESNTLASRTLAASLEIQLTASQQQVKELSIRLAESQTRFIALQGDLKKADIAVAEYQEINATLQRLEGVVADQNRTIARLKREVAIAESTTTHLSAERRKEMKEQSKWQHRCRELESECDRHQSVLADLDHHNAEMQEKIFKHTRQVGEYESAIQFWKERYRSSQRQLEQLKQLLEREAPHLSEDTAEGLLQAVQLAMHVEGDAPSSPEAFPSPQFNTVDMPEFLIRRHASRHRPFPSQDLKQCFSDESNDVGLSDSSSPSSSIYDR